MFKLARIKRLAIIGLILFAGFLATGSLQSVDAAGGGGAAVHGSSDASGEAHADGEHAGGHHSPIVPVLLSLVVVLLAAKLGGDIAVRLGQPEVLGELVFGLLLGNLALLGVTVFDYLKHDSALEVLSELGVILLLFEVGLETSVDEMMKVGVSSLIVALLGVVVPFFLGWGVGAMFVPDADTLVHIFIGATLTATSVGITARVLKDIGKIQAGESKIILGAAVIDDVLGLLTLAVVSAIITAKNSGSEVAMSSILQILFLAIGFLAVAIMLGRFLSPLCFKFATYLRSHGILLATSLSLCFGISYLAGIVGLAPIVGAFTAGLILEPIHYKDLSEKHGEEHEIDHLLHPITALLVPIFFIVMGARVDLSVFANPSIIGFSIVLTIAAIIGKQICSLGAFGEGIDKLTVGLGMIPRGEVGLIFAGIGAGLTLNGEAVVNNEIFGAVVIMVILTTFITPPLIKWRFGGSESTKGGDGHSAGVNGNGGYGEKPATAGQGFATDHERPHVSP